MSVIAQNLIPTQQRTGELDPNNSSISEQVLGGFEYNDLDRDILMVGPDDYRVQAAKELEVENMVALGDPAEEVWEEFIPYNDDSLFLLAYHHGAAPTIDNMQGMMRLIPWAGKGRIKTISDLATIKKASLEDYEQRFMADSGCMDLSKVAEIATLATAAKPDPDAFASRRDWALALQEWHKTPDSLSRATIQFLIDEFHKGTLTHMVSFNDVHAHNYFTTRLGYPLQDMFGEKPMVYATFSDVGMTAQPAWAHIEWAISALRDQKTKHLRAFAMQLAVDSPKL